MNTRQKISGGIVRRALVGLLALTMAPVGQAQTSVDEIADDLLLRSDVVIGELSEHLVSGDLGKNREEALRIIQKYMSPIISYEALSRRALGKHWRRIEKDQRQGISDALQYLLEVSYAKVLARYTDQKLKLKSVKELANKNVSVLVTVSGSEGKGAEIEYVYIPVDDQYLIGNIKIEGISLVAHYRRQFADVIEKQGPEKLIATLTALADR